MCAKLSGVRPTDPNMTIGERVAWYRRRRGLSQEVLAGLVGLTTDWLSRVENGRANLERHSVIKLLADSLNVTIGELLGEPAIVKWNPTGPARTLGAPPRGTHELPVADRESFASSTDAVRASCSRLG